MKLEQLEVDTIKLIQSVRQIAKRPAVLWSTGKDSTTMLHLISRAYGKIPWPIVHLDTERKFKEIYEFRTMLQLKWGFRLVVAKNEEALRLGISPETVSRYTCCSLLKTEVLKNTMLKWGFDALIVSIRHDEHYVRGMEDLLSFRDEEGNWRYWGRFGGFGLNAPEREGYSHLRIHAILPWREIDVWRYIQGKRLPVNPLYFSRDGKRYRTLGCQPCTNPIESNAKSISEIIRELEETEIAERAGRAQDKEDPDTMLRLRALGYM